MKNKFFLKGITLALLFSFLSAPGFAKISSWSNDLRSKFIANDSVIYTINIRTFGAVDTNGNDIIEPLLGDVQGNFVNATAELEKLTKLGVNTIYLLPITKTGKLKALGTAGSLYALDSFEELSPLLDDPTNELSVEKEAQLFIEEAHRLGFRVIVDLPSCGSYDLSLARPDLFIRNKGETVIPADWTDVRLFKVYNDDGSLNQALVSEFKKLITFLQNLGVDGVRADVAAIKPYAFWKDVIDYVRMKDKEFLFIAEACPKWSNPASKYATYETVDGLLRAGFDGYYGDWANFKDITKAKDFFKRIQNDLKITKKFEGTKTTMASFATHDQQSTIVSGGIKFWEMVMWLNITLPTNPYFLDGFTTGDDYIYRFENKKASSTYTDDDYYFVHRAKFDIFNFSRKPNGRHTELYKKFIYAMKFRYWVKDIILNGDFITLKTSNPSVFAFARQKGKDLVIVAGNLDKDNKIKSNIQVKGIKESSFVSPIKAEEPPVIKRSKIEARFEPYEIQVYVVTPPNF